MSETISEKEMIEASSVVVNSDVVYCLMDIRTVNMNQGKGYPGIIRTPERSVIVLFSSMERGREYVDRWKLEVLDGVYPLGIVRRDDKICGIQTLLATAAALKIESLDFDPGSEDGFGCSLAWFMQAHNISREVSIVLSKEEAEKQLKNEEKAGVPLRFNPLDVADFKDPYTLSKEASRAILEKIFAANTSEKAFAEFSKCSMFELCHMADWLRSMAIPLATKDNKQDDLQFFKAVGSTLDLVIVSKLSSLEKVWTIYDKEGKPVVRNNTAYILYTDRYKYMGEYAYRELEGDDKCAALKKLSGCDSAIVTDGPHGMALIPLISKMQS